MRRKLGVELLIGIEPITFRLQEACNNNDFSRFYVILPH